MIIDPVTMLKIAPIVMDLVGKYTGKEKAASIFNNILSLSTLGDVFKDPKIDETPETPEPEVPEVPKVPSGRYTSGIGNLLQIDPDKLNFGKSPIRSISPLSGINNLIDW